MRGGSYRRQTDEYIVLNPGTEKEEFRCYGRPRMMKWVEKNPGYGNFDQPGRRFVFETGGDDEFKLKSYGWVRLSAVREAIKHFQVGDCFVDTNTLYLIMGRYASQTNEVVTLAGERQIFGNECMVYKAWQHDWIELEAKFDKAIGRT